ncbi:hypothetical protein HK414_15755 [Ramlibacter terrae]|uniref:TolC family protein n=1 Tax=Ramlibacter terrae TaxID=2732511 RepID=A0ABX6P3A4_9BURK|nr:hypothetical protein HK414_15755 [Ramlibacter terrae]
MKAALLALCAVAGLITGGPATAQAPLAQRALAASEDGPPPLLSGRVALEPRQLAQLVATRNAEIRYSRLGVDVAGQLSRAEASLYETVFFGSIKNEDRERQRTAEERISSAAGLTVLDETTATAEAGLRQRLPTAAEVAVSYRMFRRSNNIIAAATNNLQDTEYNGAVVISVKQPLLRNRGRDVLETDRRIAELEEQVQWMQFRQQVLKSTSDALNLYWQLHRAQRPGSCATNRCRTCAAWPATSPRASRQGARPRPAGWKCRAPSSRAKSR